MPKRYRILTLATTRQEWKEYDEEIRDSVGKLCDFGDYEKAEALFGLLDLLTNEQYDKQNRDILVFDALRETFRFTEAFDKAVKAEVARVNPIGIKKTA